MSIRYFYSDKKVCFRNMHRAIFITPNFLETKLREALFGGRTEVFQNHTNGRPYKGVDVNSLYPFAATAPLPTGPGIYKKKRSKFSLKTFKNFFGFMRVEFLSPPDLTLFPVLPRRHPNKYTIYALGIGKGWYFSKEIQLAYKKGYKFKVLETIEYCKYPILRNFCKTLYKQRTEYSKNTPMNLIIKLMLNSLSYGNWAIRLDKEILELVDLKFNENDLLEHYGNENEKRFMNESLPQIDVQFLSNFKKTPLKPASVHKKNFQRYSRSHLLYPEKNTLDDTYYSQISLKKLSQAVQVSSAVTSQARIMMYPFLEMLYKENLLLYTDTDSIYYLNDQKIQTRKTKLQRFSKRFDPQKMGFFKIEKEGTLAIFLAQKIYLAIPQKDSKEDLMLKLKGFSSTQMIEEQKNLVELFNKSIEENQGNLTYTEQNRSLFKKKKSEWAIQILQNVERTLSTNASNDKFRKKICANQKWVRTESYVYDMDFKEISIDQLKEQYNNFSSNVESFFYKEIFSISFEI